MPAMFKRNIYKEFLLASLDILSHSKNCFWKPHQIFVEAFLRCWSIFSYVQTFMADLIGTIFRITATFGTTLRITCCYRKAGTPEHTPWRGLLEGFSELVSDNKETSTNFILGFLHKRHPKIVKTISANAKSIV
jgi:hypothetical protein